MQENNEIMGGASRRQPNKPRPFIDGGAIQHTGNIRLWTRLCKIALKITPKIRGKNATQAAELYTALAT